jgi:hypothetical protein
MSNVPLHDAGESPQVRAEPPGEARLRVHTARPHRGEELRLDPTRWPRLTIVPLTWRQASAFNDVVHRHHAAPRGCKFALGVVDHAGRLRGVALCGRPVARWLDDGLTVEVNRTATDGCDNANSALYAACWRVAAAMGYRRIITYTQEGESGVSLTAAGFVKVAELPARGSWSAASVALRHLRDPIGSGGVDRARWEKTP